VLVVKLGNLFSRRVHAAQNRSQLQRRVNAAAKQFGRKRHNPLLYPPCWTLWQAERIMTDMGWQGIINGSLLWAELSPIARLFEKAWSEWLILGLAILAGLLAVAAYIIAKIRAEPAKKELQASQWLAKYGDLHSKGGLSDEEFRTIKTKLSEQLRNELNDNGDKG
jgi:hypothetical protein